MSVIKSEAYRSIMQSIATMVDGTRADAITLTPPTVLVLETIQRLITQLISLTTQLSVNSVLEEKDCSELTDMLITVGLNLHPEKILLEMKRKDLAKGSWTGVFDTKQMPQQTPGTWSIAQMGTGLSDSPAPSSVSHTPIQLEQKLEMLMLDLSHAHVRIDILDKEITAMKTALKTTDSESVQKDLPEKDTTGSNNILNTPEMKEIRATLEKKIADYMDNMDIKKAAKKLMEIEPLLVDCYDTLQKGNPNPAISLGERFYAHLASQPSIQEMFQRPPANTAGTIPHYPF